MSRCLRSAPRLASQRFATPFAATTSEIDDDDCLGEFPIVGGAVEPEVVMMCVELMPEVCEIITCTETLPASDTVAFDEQGNCDFVCPAGEMTGYASDGCGGPGPVLICSPPPPPCADDYCTCEGETIQGCGLLPVPGAHAGSC